MIRVSIERRPKRKRDLVRRRLVVAIGRYVFRLTRDEACKLAADLRAAVRRAGRPEEKARRRTRAVIRAEEGRDYLEEEWKPC
jgi:hypothetical protein